VGSFWQCQRQLYCNQVLEVKNLKNPATGRVDLVWLCSLATLALYSGFSYLFELAQGQKSEFYAAIATSMSKSLSNFWFGAADPAGTITLDKIPGSYWFPALFVKLFGISTWSVNAPNAIASVIVVIVVAYTARELGGRGAGLIAGAVVAATPILSAVARSNQPESFLLLWLSVATWFGVKALKNNSFSSLMWAGVFIAVAFHSYMMVAWALWPALGIAYLTTDQRWVTKVWQLLAAGLTSLALSFVWIVSVMLTPAANRPYIGGSNTNSALEMVFGYNGLGRFSDLTSGTSVSTTVRGFTPPFSGSPSPLRLLNSQLLPQIGWLVPATLVAIVVIFALKNFTPTAWFVSLYFTVFALMFSVVAGMHQFYTSALAAPMALVLATSYATARRSNKTWVKIPVIATAVISAAYVGIQYSSYLLWAPVVQFVIGIVAVIVILVGVSGKAKVLLPGLIAAALVFSPAVWSADTRSYPSSINPLAGPTNSMGTFGGGRSPSNLAMGGPGSLAGPVGGGFGGGGLGGAALNHRALVAYLQKNRHGAKFLLTTFTTMAAASYIIETGDNILPIGGFDGSDPSPTLNQFKKYVADGQIRFVLSSGSAGGRGLGQSGSGSVTTASGRDNSSEIQSWVTTNCKLDESTVGAGMLYKCSPSSLN